MKSKLVWLLGSCSVIAHIGLFAVTLLLPACSSTSDSGSLVVTWTIASTSDAKLCNKYVGWVVVQVKNSLGQPYSSSNAPCNSFATSFANVPAGTYSVSAYMLNADNETTISTASPATVSVNSGLSTTESIDFPIAVSN